MTLYVESVAATRNLHEILRTPFDCRFYTGSQIVGTSLKRDKS